MTNNRLEFYCTTSVKVGALVLLILFGGLEVIYLLMIIVALQHSYIEWGALLSFGFFLPSFILVFSRIFIVFTKGPHLIIDEKGIQDNQRWKPLTIPWNDITEISFPRRGYASDRVLNIKLKEPQEYVSRSFLHELNRRVSPDYRNWVISLRFFKEEARDVVLYLLKLEEEGQVPLYIV